MDDSLVKFSVEDLNGQTWEFEAPTDMSLSLMEVMKGEGVPVLATCGGMALCATCHVEVLHTDEKLPEPGNNELDMLDTLPDARPNSRLSCQIRISHALQGARFRFLGEDNQ